MTPTLKSSVSCLLLSPVKMRGYFSLELFCAIHILRGINMNENQRLSMRDLLKAALHLHFGVFDLKERLDEPIPLQPFTEANSAMMTMAYESGLSRDDVLDCLGEVMAKIEKIHLDLENLKKSGFH